MNHRIGNQSHRAELPKEVISAGKLCPKCGNSLEEGDAFCIQCGYKF